MTRLNGNPEFSARRPGQLAFGIVTPEATERAPLQENGSTETGAVMRGVAHDVEHQSACPGALYGCLLMHHFPELWPDFTSKVYNLDAAATKHRAGWRGAELCLDTALLNEVCTECRGKVPLRKEIFAGSRDGDSMRLPRTATTESSLFQSFGPPPSPSCPPPAK